MELYLFDLDGTLADSRAGLHASFRAGLAALDCPPPADPLLDTFLGTPLPIMFRAFRPNAAPTDIARAMAAFRAHYDREGIRENRLYPGVTEMLLAVRAAGGRAWIVTSKPEMHAVRVVQLLAIDQLVKGVVGAGFDETDTKAELIARALSLAGTAPDDAIMLGDRHYDVLGARENAVTPVGALWGYGTRAELADAGCRHFVTSPAEFRAQFVQAGATMQQGLVA